MGTCERVMVWRKVETGWIWNIYSKYAWKKMNAVKIVLRRREGRRMKENDEKGGFIKDVL